MEKGYIKISNEGVMDINSLMLLGATSKRGNENMIGYFGSGLKYAIAVLLKHEIPFRIFAGEKEIKVQVVKKNFRGKEFDVIKINNKLTSLTTDMGPDWESWFAVREIYCNAIDEGKYNLGIADNPEGKKNETTFFISFDERLAELFSNWSRYFSDKRTDMILDSKEQHTKIFAGNSKELIIYRKGVRCHHEKTNSLYHYDCGWVEINESRTIKNTWDLRYHLPQILAKIAKRGVIKNIYDNYKGKFEEEFNWEYAHSFNEEWLKALNGRKIVIDLVAGYFQEEIASSDCIMLPKNLANALKDYFGTSVTVLGMSDKHDSGVQLNITTRQAQYVNDALGFLKKGGIEVKYPIVAWEFKNEQVMGEGKDGQIRLSPKVFDTGKREVVLTILEEMSHLESGQADKTRGFQNYLFNKLIVLLEDKAGERI